MDWRGLENEAAFSQHSPTSFYPSSESPRILVSCCLSIPPGWDWPAISLYLCLWGCCLVPWSFFLPSLNIPVETPLMQNSYFTKLDSQTSRETVLICQFPRLQGKLGNIYVHSGFKGLTVEDTPWSFDYPLPCGRLWLCSDPFKVESLKDELGWKAELSFFPVFFSEIRFWAHNKIPNQNLHRLERWFSG